MNNNDNPSIVKELTEKSTKDTKYYLLSNGNYRMETVLSEEENGMMPMAIIPPSSPKVTIDVYQVDNFGNIVSSAEFVKVGQEGINQYGIFLKITPQLYSEVISATSVKIDFTERNPNSEEYNVWSSEGLSHEQVYLNHIDYANIKSISGVQHRVIDLTEYFANTDKIQYCAIMPSVGKNTVFLYTSQASNPSYRPVITFDYVPEHKTEFKQSHIQGDAGEAGNCSINTRTGRVLFQKPLFNLGGNKMPMDLSLIYSTVKFNSSDMNSGLPTYFPNGWKTNYHQCVYLKSGNYYYVDSQYVVHKFALAQNPHSQTPVYYDTSGQRLTLSQYSEDGFNGYIIKDLSKNSFIFNSEGMLAQIKDSLGNTATVAYDSALTTQIIGITDGMGRTANLTYSTNTVSIEKPDEKTVTITSSSNRLTTVTDADGAQSIYAYDSSGRLNNAKDRKGQQLSFNFGEQNKLVTFTESVYSGSSTQILSHHSLTYRALHTLVKSAKNTDNFNSQYTQKSYWSDIKGDFLGSYELTEEDSIASPNFVSMDRYEQVNYKTLGRPLYAATFSGKKQITMEMSPNQTTKNSDENLMSLPPPAEGTKYYFCLDATLTNIKYNSSWEDLSNVELYYQDSDLYYVRLAAIDVYAVTMDNQFLCKEFTLDTATPNLFVKIVHAGSGDLTLRNIGVYKSTDIKQMHCINQPCAGYPQFAQSDDDTEWYKLTDLVKFTYGASVEVNNAYMTLADLNVNLENFYRASDNQTTSEFNLWYNDGKNLVQNASNVTLHFQEVSFDLSDIGAASYAQTWNKHILSYAQYGTGNQYVKECAKIFNEDEDAPYITYKSYDDKYLLKEEKTPDDIVSSYSYDGYGNMTSSETYAQSSPSEKIRRSYAYTSGGQFLSQQSSYLGTSTFTQSETSDLDTGNLTSATTARSQTTSYTYDTANNTDLTEIASTVESTENANTFNYTNGLVDKISHNGFNYAFTYDTRNNPLSVRVGEGEEEDINQYDTLLTKNRTYSANLDTSETVYGNGQKLKNTYDIYGRLIEVSEYDSGTYTPLVKHYYGLPNEGMVDENPAYDTWAQNSSGVLRRTIDFSAGLMYTYYYDNLGKLSACKVFQDSTTGYSLSYTYDNLGRLTAHGSSVSDYQTIYTYDSAAGHENRIADSSTLCSSQTWKTEDAYDPLNRLSVTKTTLGTTSALKFYLSYYDTAYLRYVDPDEPIPIDSIGEETENAAVAQGIQSPQGIGYWERIKTGTTNFLHRVDYYTSNGGVETSLGADALSYDADGNITNIGNWDGSSSSYVYDGLGRLTRENNSKLNRTYTYSYNAGGNITLKREYYYTTGTLNNLISSYGYSYGNAKWKDQLTSYNGTGITYDACGNPLSYKGATLAWTRGRLLNSYTKSGVTSTFTYNAQGIRISKKVGSATTTYTLEGNKILSDGTLTYIYNHSGLVGFRKGSTNYYYLKNVFGDIAAIYNSSNDEVAKYHYDAWGNCTVQNVVGTVGNENPFRYRGYFWDNDLQLYYCQSRYYDPQIGRWISPDTLDYLEPSQLNGLNLYAYCGNNPVMYCDPSGHAIISILLGLLVISAVGGLINGTMNLIGATVTGDTATMLSAFWGGFVNGAINALALGVGIVFGGWLGFAIATGGGFVGGFVGSVAQQTSYNKMMGYDNTINYGEAAVSGLISAFFNGLTYGITIVALGPYGANALPQGNFLQRFIQTFAINETNLIVPIAITKLYTGPFNIIAELLRNLLG